jgi:phosphoenolpyruvate carboxykinase (GTP)
MPLVLESFSWKRGVLMGAIMGAETTAAATGKIGVLRRDPMAMLPFCGYNMADYFGHWLRLGTQIPRPPKVFFINWFRTDENGKYIWPGFGENIRALKWVISRVSRSGQEGARETPIGFVPEKGSLDTTGLQISEETLTKLCEVNREEWKGELADARNFLNQFGARMPKEIWDDFQALENAVSRP